MRRAHGSYMLVGANQAVEADLMSGGLQSVYEAATRTRSDNPDTLRRARLLNALIAGVLVLGALAIPLQTLIWRGMPSVVTVTVIAAGLLIGVVALQVSRRGDPQAAAYLVLGTLWVVITVILLIQPDEMTAFAFLPYMYALP